MIGSNGLFNVFQFYNPVSDMIIKGNRGFVTPAAIAAGKSLVTVYLFNPGFGTLNWSNLVLEDNDWNFTGSTTAAYTFTISSGSGFAVVTNQYPMFAREGCAGCTYANTDKGQQNLATSTTIKPVGPEIHVFAASLTTATIDASKSIDSSQVKIVNTGAGTVTFAADANMDFATSVVVATTQGAIFPFRGSESKISYRF
ncbi:MAG TPA: hypothetical protein VK638_57245 [Edaphobacter sp.]|nr:hypothetical protein [Edaphobacter sp.]